MTNDYVSHYNNILTFLFLPALNIDDEINDAILFTKCTPDEWNLRCLHNRNVVPIWANFT